MKLNNLEIVFSEVYKLAELILIFPSTSKTAERSYSVLKRIETYLRTHRQVRLSNLAVISTTKSTLLDMKKWSEETFYDAEINTKGEDGFLVQMKVFKVIVHFFSIIITIIILYLDIFTSFLTLH